MAYITPALKSLQNLTVPTVEEGSSGPVSGIPAGFLNADSSYEFRIWPDTDPTNGEPRLLRIVDGHNLPIPGSDEGRIRCLADSTLNRLAQRLKKAGRGDSWKLRSRRVGMTLVHLFKAPSENDFLSPGTDTVLLMNQVQTRQLIATLKLLTTGGMSGHFDPSKKAPTLILRVKGKGKDQEVEVTMGNPTHMPNAEPRFEDGEWTSLDDIYIPANAEITDDERDALVAEWTPAGS